MVRKNSMLPHGVQCLTRRRNDVACSWPSLTMQGERPMFCARKSTNSKTGYCEVSTGWRTTGKWVLPFSRCPAAMREGRLPGGPDLSRHGTTFAAGSQRLHKPTPCGFVAADAAGTSSSFGYSRTDGLLMVGTVFDETLDAPHRRPMFCQPMFRQSPRASPNALHGWYLTYLISGLGDRPLAKGGAFTL